MNLNVRVLDLDHAVPRQQSVMSKYRPQVIPMTDWGPKIRMGCAFRRFRAFARDLAKAIGSEKDGDPTLTLYGSGDFHHVSLALLARQASPCNLAVIDNHPDWMRGVPFLHCGTWVHHAARLGHVRRIIHIGGDVDFDNLYRFMAPWPALHRGKMIVIPARRPFERGPWRRLAHAPLMTATSRCNLSADGFQELLRPIADDLRRWPLYISLDKDVLTAVDALVNWDSGHLQLADVRIIFGGLLEAAGRRLAGMDIVGDWSPVRVQGLFRRFLHWTEHPALSIDSDRASDRNALTNGIVIDDVARHLNGLSETSAA